jgi:hypothetical protein
MNTKDSVNFMDAAGGGLQAGHSVAESFDPKGVFKVVCRAPDGSVRWEIDFPNLVVTVGKNDLLDKYFRGSAYTAAFFVGLKAAGTIAAGDTMASHAGWTEITAYSNATRPAFTAAVPSAGSTSNSASPAVFNINGTATVAGCFITTNSTKGGTTGILFSATDFAVARNVLSGDTLTVTYTISC